MTDTGVRRSLSATLLLTLCAWSLLLTSRLASGLFGSEGALLLGFTLATALVAATRGSVRGSVGPGDALLGLAADYLSFAAWVALVSVVGLALGLEPGVSFAEPGLAFALASLVLAPVFEELLYRERLLPALRDRLGAPLALATSSLLFALPHLERWSVLGAFLVGLFLGAVYLAKSSVALCIGLHAGLNLAAFVAGPAARPGLAPPVLPGLLLAALLLARALRRPRSRSARARPRSRRWRPPRAGTGPPSGRPGRAG